MACARGRISVAARRERGADAISERRRIVIELNDRDLDAVIAEARFDEGAREARRGGVEQEDVVGGAGECGVERRLDVDAREAGIETGDAERIAQWSQGMNPGPDEQDFHRARAGYEG